MSGLVATSISGLVGLYFISANVFAEWLPLSEDNLHDPDSPAIAILQEPGQALSVLAPDTAGNKVDWLTALRLGEIEPRTNIFPETKIEVLDQDILMKETSDMPMVLFPHEAHTLWLDCSNCHDKLFKREIGTTEFGMFDILAGRYCGQCHGAVAFPLTECKRCHSVSRK